MKNKDKEEIAKKMKSQAEKDLRIKEIETEITGLEERATTLSQKEKDYKKSLEIELDKLKRKPL